jgi:hypothetical protein
MGAVYEVRQSKLLADRCHESGLQETTANGKRERRSLRSSRVLATTFRFERCLRLLTLLLFPDASHFRRLVGAKGLFLGEPALLEGLLFRREGALMQGVRQHAADRPLAE